MFISDFGWSVLFVSDHIYSVVTESVQPNASRIQSLFRAAPLQLNSNKRHRYHCSKLVDCDMVHVFTIFFSLLRYLLQFWLRIIIFIDAVTVT